MEIAQKKKRRPEAKKIEDVTGHACGGQSDFEDPGKIQVLSLPEKHRALEVPP